MNDPLQPPIAAASDEASGISRARQTKRIFVTLLVIWQLLLLVFLTAAGTSNRTVGLMAGMVWGVCLLWIGGCGLLSTIGREAVCRVIRRVPLAAPITFFLFATLLALIEEAIATLMTNCAPFFGAKVGEVYITASADYLDVVLFHSVVVFLAQFATWAWLLRRYDFSPFSVFLLFGLGGAVNETLFAGPQLLSLAQWILVYGLMVYLPACCFGWPPGRLRVRWWHYPAAIVLPILASLPVVALMLHVIAPGHPSIHFPPIGGQ
jgi:hypothetical protein